ncbi:unnamed protein product [Auanema sp. JU1783]|nr:unnamed protein product [Auanema sp. JU1783]
MSEKGRLVNEFESYFYEFSPRGFTDGVYNAIIDSWSESVGIHLEDPQLASLVGNKSFQSGLLGFLFRSECKFKTILNNFTDYAIRYIFRIPTSVTLPEHREAHVLAIEQERKEEMYDATAVEKKLKAMEYKIIEMRFKIAEMRSLINEVDDTAKVMEAMENAAEQKELEYSQNSTIIASQ